MVHFEMLPLGALMCYWPCHSSTRNQTRTLLLCINLLLTTISVPTCLFRRFVPSSCTCYCSIGKKNNLWDIGKKYWTWPFQVVYFPMIEIKYMFFWILHLTLQVMNSSTSSRLLTKVYQTSCKGKILVVNQEMACDFWQNSTNVTNLVEMMNKVETVIHRMYINLIDHPSRGWHCVKHVRGNLSGQSTSHQQNQGPRYFHDIHLFCLVLEIELVCISYPLLRLGWFSGSLSTLIMLRVSSDLVCLDWPMGNCPTKIT